MSTYDLEEALRALKDRPSMERELAELRQRNRRLETTSLTTSAECQRDLYEKECIRLEAENERLRAALREIASRDPGVDWVEGATINACEDCLLFQKIARAALDPAAAKRDEKTRTKPKEEK